MAGVVAFTTLHRVCEAAFAVSIVAGVAVAHAILIRLASFKGIRKVGVTKAGKAKFPKRWTKRFLSRSRTASAKSECSSTDLTFPKWRHRLRSAFAYVDVALKHWMTGATAWYERVGLSRRYLWNPGIGVNFRRRQRRSRVQVSNDSRHVIVDPLLRCCRRGLLVTHVILR